jgi:hypothetical protein
MRPGCGSCRHWVEATEPGDPERWGTCYRNPPKAAYTDEDGVFSIRPPVNADEKPCGEYAGVN